MAFLSYFNELVNKNKQNFADFEQINWLNPYKAELYEEKRNHLIDHFSKKINWAFKNTKPWINKISNGCELCGKGEWSCIFITGQCNANCFYCPAPQNNDDLPMAQQLSFELSNHYAEYINFFDFKGVSFSGGEPFLVYDRLIDYLETIRKNCKPDIYIWLYTNGILTKQDKFKQLRDSGLNEIRFDIGATLYQLEHIKKAKGIIENITIEIPLVPERTEQIKQLLPQMIEAGVNYLNLHQLRLTNYNAHKLLKNDYTYLHGEHPVVLESELGVLDIIDFVDKSELDIGINYCSFQYKSRFQKAGYRNKLSRKIFPDEEITENGYFLNIYGGKTELAFPGIISDKLIVELIREKKINKLSLHELILKHKDYNFLIFDFSGMTLENKTSGIKSNFKIREQNYFIEKGKTIHPVVFFKEEISKLIEFISKKDYDLIPEEDKLFLIWKHVFIEQGFRPYL